MHSIPLNLLSLYADIQQRTQLMNVAPASISRKKIDGRAHLYAVIKEGASRRQVYLGAEDQAGTAAKVEAHRQAARQRAQLKKSVQALKRSGIYGPDVALGRVLEAIGLAGLFQRGAVLVGTVAYQQFPCLVGAYLSEGSARTEDADLATTRLGLRHLVAESENLLTTLKRADDSFAASYARPHKLPRRFVSQDGFIVELLTTRGRSDAPVAVPQLGCMAMPLAYLDYLIEDPVDALVLYGAGVPVRVPDPARYAVHKLIVHRIRTEPVKRMKDFVQARELIGIYRERDPDRLEVAIEEAVKRGPGWQRLVQAGLRLVDRAR